MPADLRPRRVRCARCLVDLWTTHAWEHVTCACGAVTVSGLPWRPRVDWWASPAGGWSFLDETVLDPGCHDPARDTEDADGTGHGGPGAPAGGTRVTRPPGFGERG